MQGKFYPKWYKKRKESDYVRKNKVILIIATLIGVYMVISLVKGLEELSNLKNVEKTQNSVKAFDTTYPYEYLAINIESLEPYIKNLYFQEQDIIIEIYATDFNDYLSKINTLETRFNLLEVGGIIEEEGEEFFKVRMNIKNESL